MEGRGEEGEGTRDGQGGSKLIRLRPDQEYKRSNLKNM